MIFLSFKDVKCSSWQETFQKISKLISLEFMRHNELESSSVLSSYEKEQYHRFASENINEVDCQMGLQLLSLLLHKHYDKECVIIIDEYDTPIQQDHLCEFYNEIVDFMRNFFSGGLKDNPHLAFGFLTGILRVAKESIFSGMNNLKTNSISIIIIVLILASQMKKSETCLHIMIMKINIKKFANGMMDIVLEIRKYLILGL